MRTQTTLNAADAELTPQQALRRAWSSWLVLLAIPLLVIFVAFHLLFEAVSPNVDLAHRWFLAVAVYLVVALPAATFWRSHLFKSYWRGRAVDPRSYLRGMVLVWAALALGGLFAALGCVITNTIAPNVLLAGVVLITYLTLWPSGKAMERHEGDLDDPELYQEPR